MPAPFPENAHLYVLAVHCAQATEQQKCSWQVHKLKLVDCSPGLLAGSPKRLCLPSAFPTCSAMPLRVATMTPFCRVLQVSWKCKHPCYVRSSASVTLLLGIVNANTPDQPTQELLCVRSIQLCWCWQTSLE